MMKSLFLRSAVLAPLLTGPDRWSPPAPHSARRRSRPVDPALFKGMQWREVGPYRGGRVAAVTGIAGDRNTYYFGATGGGVWKTTDGGTTWKNVSDGFFGGSIGAVAVADVGPERRLRRRRRGDHPRQRLARRRRCGSRPTPARPGRTSASTTRGTSRASASIPRTPTSSTSPALGHAFGPNDERGVYRSQRRRQDTGSASSSSTTTRARSTWPWTRPTRASSTRRPGASGARPYSFESGGAGSALWKSTDGGDTWNELIAQPRACRRGRSASSASRVSPSNPQNVYAIVEAEGRRRVPLATTAARPGRRPASDRDLRQRAWYYTPHLRRSEGRGHGLRRQRPLPQVEGRRQDVAARSARRTATTTISGSTRTIRSG